MVVVALVVWALHRFGWPGVQERVHASLPGALRAGLEHPRAGLVFDGVLVLGVLWLVQGPLWACWAELSPLRAPAGPDASNYLGSALAFETGNWGLAFEDRYPGYPWLISLFAEDAVSVPRVGTELSMVATVLSAIPLYGLGRLMVGRAAGFVGAWLGLRQILAIDVGHSFTSYPVTAFLDLTLLWLALFFVRGGARWAAVATGLVGILTISMDPKQVPLVLATLGICAVWTLAWGQGKAGWRWVNVAFLLGPLPVLNWVVGQLPVKLLSLEGILIRTPINVVGDGFQAYVETGFALGRADAGWLLLPSLWRVFTQLAPKDGGLLDPQFINGVPLIWPDTSYVWGAAVLVLPFLLLWTWRGRRSRFAALALVLVYWSSVSPTLRLHYGNRYLQPHALAAPGAVAVVAQSVLGGPAIAAAGLAAVFWSSSPFASVDPSYHQIRVPGTDSWVGSGGGLPIRSMEWAQESLPQDITLFDYTMVDPPIILAAVAPYVRCAPHMALCARDLPATSGHLGVILRAGEQLSGWVPDGDGEAFDTPLPARVGRCWRLRRKLDPRTGIYVWKCNQRPSRQRVINHAIPDRPTMRRGPGDAPPRPGQ